MGSCPDTDIDPLSCCRGDFDKTSRLPLLHPRHFFRKMKERVKGKRNYSRTYFITTTRLFSTQEIIFAVFLLLKLTFLLSLKTPLTSLTTVKLYRPLTHKHLIVATF